MVTRPLAVVAVLVVLAVGGWYARAWVWPDEAARVRAAVDTLAATVTSAGAASQGAGQLAALADLRTQLAEDVTIEAARRALLVEGREEVLGLAARLSGSPARLSLSFTDVTVVLTGDEQTAIVGATAQVDETSAVGSQSFDAQQIDMVWERQGRSWLLGSVKAIDILR